MDAPALAERFVFRGHEIRYGVLGSGPPLVLLHGTPWSSCNLRYLIRDLSADHRVYYYDMLGYGQSAMPDDDVSLGVQNELLMALLGHWGLETPAVVAHDYGGATALRAALLNGAAFRRLVLVDPVAVAPWGSVFFAHVRRHEAAFAGVPANIHEAIVRAYIQSAAYRPLPPAVLDATAAPWCSEAGRAGFYRQIAQADQAYTDAVQPRYGELTCPVLILWGTEDAWIPVDRAYTLHGLLPDSRLRLVPEAGHLVVEERPEALLREMRPFLAA